MYASALNSPLSNRDEDGHVSDKEDKKLQAPDAQHNHTITVREVQVQRGNPFDHITLQVDSNKEVGYAPKQDMTKKEILENKAVSGQVEPRASGVKTEDQVTIHVTAGQAKAAQHTIDNTAKNPGNYVLYGGSSNNCATFAEHVITGGGGKAPNDVRPSRLINDIRQQQYKDNSTQTPNK